MKYQELQDVAWKYSMGEVYDTEYAEKINPATLLNLLAELDVKTEALSGLIDDIDNLVRESEGVSGLHLNGDVASWDELLPNGRFERLSNLDLARSLIT